LKNWNTYISYLIILCLSFALTPNNGYSFSPEPIPVEHSCSLDTTSDNEHQEDCCQQGNSKQHHEKHCKADYCKCIHSACSIFVVFIQDKAEDMLFSIMDKEEFGITKFDLSFGYSSIWQPPKIA